MVLVAAEVVAVVNKVLDCCKFALKDACNNEDEDDADEAGDVMIADDEDARVAVGLDEGDFLDRFGGGGELPPESELSPDDARLDCFAFTKLLDNNNII